MRKVTTFIFLLFGFVLSTATYSEQDSNDPKLSSIPISANKQGVAIDGYDSVAYFTEQRAIKGEAEFFCNWQGKKWLFSSEENKQKFLANPERYAPQYGGHCASAISNGKLVNASPVAWTVHEEKLYLNANTKVQEKWLKDIQKNVKAGHGEWMRNILNVDF